MSVEKWIEKPYYIFQLPQEDQDALCAKVRFVLLYDFEFNADELGRYYGENLETLVQNAMDSKIHDLEEIHCRYDEILRELYPDRYPSEDDERER